MSAARIARRYATVACVFANLAAVLSVHVADAQNVPRCLEADVKMISNVSSAFALPGDSFEFKLVQRVAQKGNVPNIPANTRGYGIVAYADHAHGAGTPGKLVLEPRFLTLPDGAHEPVLASPQLSEAFVQGQTRSVNGALAFVPGVGLAVSGYNALHRGREITVPPGTTFRIVVGDELALAQCSVPAPDAPDIR